MSDPQRPSTTPGDHEIGHFTGDIGGEEATVLYQKSNEKAWIQSSVTVADLDIYE